VDTCAWFNHGTQPGGLTRNPFGTISVSLSLSALERRMHYRPLVGCGSLGVEPLNPDLTLRDANRGHHL
jgi:hypothetical protein